MISGESFCSSKSLRTSSPGFAAYSMQSLGSSLDGLLRSQVGSALAYRGIPLQSAYCGAKHAIRGFTESLRCELLHHKSRVWISMVQMPALNTPQFDWCLNKMGRRAQPVPPIYSADLAADAVYFSATHRRRELYVGGSTAAVILGEKLAPGAGDRYLGRTGYRSQQYDGRSDDGRSNLWRPVDESVDHGADGVFAARTHARSFELWTAMHKRALLCGLSLACAAGLALFLRRRGWRRT